jgi:hypothetical protein
MNNWYSICALNEGAEISIYDEIGAYGVSAKGFLADLGKLPDKAPLTIQAIIFIMCGNFLQSSKAFV